MRKFLASLTNIVDVLVKNERRAMEREGEREEREREREGEGERERERET
jgi:hypothetical protein